MTTKLEFKISFLYRLQAIFSFNMFGLAIVRNGLLPLCFRLLLAKYRLSSQATQVISHISLFTIPFHHYRYIWPSLIFFDKIASAYALFSQTTKLFFFDTLWKRQECWLLKELKKMLFYIVNPNKAKCTLKPTIGIYIVRIEGCIYGAHQFCIEMSTN